MQKTNYYIAHLTRESIDNETWCLSYVMDNPEYRKNVLEYWHTANIYEAKKFETKEDLFKYLLDNPQQVHEAIILEYTDEYLESIRDNKRALWFISHPVTRDYVECPYKDESLAGQELVLADYLGRKTSFDIGDKDKVFSVYINLISGDEVAIVTYTDRSTKRFDSSTTRISNTFDGSYQLALNKIDEFNKSSLNAFDKFDLFEKPERS